MDHHHFNDLERAVLETACKEHNDRNPNGPQFFIGLTADAKNTGHALCRADGGRPIRRYWGTPEELTAILEKA